MAVGSLLGSADLDSKKRQIILDENKWQKKKKKRDVDKG